MSLAWSILTASWQVLVWMAPYLLLGFVLAGVISVLLSPDWVRRHMAGRGLWQVVKAALVGVPLPLCSCGVIPVALSLRQQGAGRGAVASFLASTPQTGVDSMVATWVMLGPVVTLFRVLAAFVSGVVAGGLVTAAYPHEMPLAEREPGAACGCCHEQTPRWRRMVQHGLVTMPRDIARPLLLGVLISGALTVVLPAGCLQSAFALTWGAYGMALLVGIPLYVCSTASIPLAASFIHLGASPGAAMVFLIAGPATNVAMLATMWCRLGRLGTILYLVAIASTAVLAGWLLDCFFPASLANVPPLSAHCASASSAWWEWALALFLLALLAPGLILRRGHAKDEGGYS